MLSAFEPISGFSHRRMLAVVWAYTHSLWLALALVQSLSLVMCALVQAARFSSELAILLSLKLTR